MGEAIRTPPVPRVPGMNWEEFVSAAQSINWVTYVGTADSTGATHVAPVAPGFSDEAMWFATRASSKKFRNLLENPDVAFHWPVGSDGPGELAAWGTATVHPSSEDRHRIWAAGYFAFDLANFFGSADNDDLAFVRVTVERARLLGPGFVADRYQRA